MGQQKPDKSRTVPSLEAHLSRRALVRSAVAMGLGMPVFAGLLAACQTDDEPTAPDVDDAGDDEAVDEPDDDDSPDDTDTTDSLDITLVQASDAQTLDPTLANLTIEWSIHSNIFDSLVQMSPEMELEPGLATDWEFEDATTLRFTIRDGVTFHDGTDLTSSDIKFTIDRTLDPDVGSPAAQWIPGVASVEAPDDETVVIMLEAPNATIVRRLYLVRIVPEATYQEMGSEDFNASPVGTGPFRFVEWSRGQHIQLEAFDDYWRGAPSIASATIRPVAETSTRIAELESGRADIVTNIPPDQAVALRDGNGFGIESVPSQRMLWLGFNPANEPFDNPLVRQAVNYAIDKEALVEELLRGDATIANGCLHQGQYGFNPDREPYPFDPDRAIEMLTEAGYPDGVDIDFDFSVGRYTADQTVAEALAAQLQDVGIRCTMNPLEGAAFVSAIIVEKTSRHLFQVGIGDPIGDADFTFTLWFDSSTPQNYFSSDELDNLVRTQRQEVDEDARLELIREADQYIYDQAGWGFLFTYQDNYGVSDRISWTPRQNEIVWLYDVETG